MSHQRSAMSETKSVQKIPSMADYLLVVYPDIAGAGEDVDVRV